VIPKTSWGGGFYLGATTYRVGEIIRDGEFCTYHGEDWTCFIHKKDYLNYIKTNNFECDDDYITRKKCLVETADCYGK